jgi:uncharacterized membrane protein
MLYVAASIVCGFTLPRIEQAYLAAYKLGLSVASTQAFLSATASGMMALTGIVFAVGMVMVQFSAIAYSPRLALWFLRDRTLFHALGVFSTTFIYALSTLAWIDREGSGTVPLFSNILVLVLLIASMFLFSLLVQRLNDLQITNVLHMVGDKGRSVIRDLFAQLDNKRAQKSNAPIQLGPITQTLRYIGEPRTIAKFDIDALTQQAEEAEAVVVMACGVGDTVVENTLLLHVHGVKPLSEKNLIQAIELATERTFEQDPKFPIRLLVDIAIKALSPAINDPTTAVQAIDQIEDLLGRLGQRELDAGNVRDSNGGLRVVLPMPTWEDYITLAFDEIRQFGASSIQIMRRLRSALVELTEMLPSPDRADVVRQHLTHLDLTVECSSFDEEDRVMARQEDRQGLGLTRRRST